MNTEPDIKVNTEINKYKILLEQSFEKELVEEILNCPIIKMQQGQIRDESEVVNPKDGIVPIVLEGKVSVFQNDNHGNKVKIYDINPAQSCILGINSILNSKNITQTYLHYPLDTKVVLVPASVSEKWFEKYKSWRVFVLDLYGRRLEELVRQHNVVSEQKVSIEEQNKKITDSITYAKRIQQAVFPTAINLKQAGWEHFILFKPRDIVSGDFYWIAKENNTVTLAAADATGHGVPGAFMSMLGIAYLNEIKELINENDLPPSLILEELRKKIKLSLNQTGKDHEAKDGMDIAMCSVSIDSLMLQFAGAHNPVYIFKKSGAFVEIKPDRQPIGIHLKEKPFTNHRFQMEKGDTFYIFSDGYADQFGGEKGGKFKSKNFRELLQSIQSKSMEEQKQILIESFEKWKGHLEQVDDILVIGIRV